MKAEELIEKKKGLAKDFHEKRTVVDVKTVLKALQLKEIEVKKLNYEPHELI